VSRRGLNLWAGDDRFAQATPWTSPVRLGRFIQVTTYLATPDRRKTMARRLAMVRERDMVTRGTCMGRLRLCKAENE
jgi:hypothetical protein